VCANEEATLDAMTVLRSFINDNFVSLDRDGEVDAPPPVVMTKKRAAPGKPSTKHFRKRRVGLRAARHIVSFGYFFEAFCNVNLQPLPCAARAGKREKW